ncbi:hypothetical protein ACIQPS_33585 [Streptomyces sp. NPDC091290]|uniref:hypothetical protein n=1 Tax=Streptomyces sp. NPDC091290 TaxID=3365990 RepID=UPI003809A362
MHSDDKPINGHPNPTFPGLLHQQPEPSVSDLASGPRRRRLARLSAGGDASWERGGFLHERWEDLFQARRLGWHEMAIWIKAVLSLAGLCAVILLTGTAVDIASTVLHQLSTPRTTHEPLTADTTSGLWGVIDNPIRHYIAEHSAALTVPSSAVHTFWQVTGLIGLIGGFAGSTGARILWTGWGLSSMAMVWSATPESSRTIATGIAALLWALASICALRGMHLRPRIDAPAPAAPQVHIYPAFQFPPRPARGHGGLGDEPGTVHRPQR